jgi:LEA14-like dessication related protein
MRKLALAAVLALSACAPLTRLQAPEVVNLAVRNVEIRLPTIRVDTELTLRNPNAVEIAVASLDADLEIAGERAGTLKLAAPVTLPAGGTASVALSAVGDAAVALTGMGRALGSGLPARTTR